MERQPVLQTEVQSLVRAYTSVVGLILGWGMYGRHQLIFLSLKTISIFLGEDLKQLFFF